MLGFTQLSSVNLLTFGILRSLSTKNPKSNLCPAGPSSRPCETECLCWSKALTGEFDDDMCHGRLAEVTTDGSEEDMVPEDEMVGEVKAPGT